MKNKFELSMILIIGFAMVAITIASLDNSILSDSNVDDTSSDSQYSNLFTRYSNAVISKSAKFIPDRTCFEIRNDRELVDHYPMDFRDSLYKASKVTSNMYDPSYGVGFQLQGVHFDLESQEAIKFLKKYNFNEKIQNFALAVRNAGYNATEGYSDLAMSQLQYNCFFNYNKQQYLFQITFYPMVPYEGHFSQVDITEKEGKSFLTNPHITVYQSFNETVVFNNKIDNDVTFLFSFVTPKNYRYAPNDITIPPGMSLTYNFGQYYIGGKIPYSYTILPYGLEGSVLVKMPPECMTEAEAESLYSEVDIKLKFPQYLLEGYEFRCGYFVTTNEILMSYDDNPNILQENLNLLTHYRERQKYFDQGGIIIDHYFLSDAKRDCDLRGASIESFQINEDTLAVYGVVNDPNSDDRWTFLRTCTDNEVHNIMGTISKEEMTNIAESIHTE